ncbi:MAG: hypothetical protein IJ638_03825, partial [Alphaproteobacteria bacterium]|nr:hypothetical protein [Alphaproteobacteria bacterium]
SSFLMCQSCPAGTYSNGGSITSCTPCPAGQYQSATGATSCGYCNTGYYSTGGAKSCTACTNKPANSYYTGSSTSNSCPWACNSGYEKSGNSCIQSCKPGYYKNASGIIEQCPAGYYCTGNSSTGCKATPCGIGYYNENTGSTSQSACTKCNPTCYSKAWAVVGGGLVREHTHQNSNPNSSAQIKLYYAEGDKVCGPSVRVYCYANNVCPNTANTAPQRQGTYYYTLNLSCADSWDGDYMMDCNADYQTESYDSTTGLLYSEGSCSW